MNNPYEPPAADVAIRNGNPEPNPKGFSHSILAWTDRLFFFIVPASIAALGWHLIGIQTANPEMLFWSSIRSMFPAAIGAALFAALPLFLERKNHSWIFSFWVSVPIGAPVFLSLFQTNIRWNLWIAPTISLGVLGITFHLATQAIARMGARQSHQDLQLPLIRATGMALAIPFSIAAIASIGILLSEGFNKFTALIGIIFIVAPILLLVRYASKSLVIVLAIVASFIFLIIVNNFEHVPTNPS